MKYFSSCLLAFLLGIVGTIVFVAHQHKISHKEVVNPTEYVDFQTVKATDISKAQIADYYQMRALDTAPLDGTNRSVYLIYNGNLVKADYYAWDAANKCAQGDYKNVFAITKKPKDLYYKLIRVTHNEPHCVVLEGL